jgi:prolyl-tRNA synthetase
VEVAVCVINPKRDEAVNAAAEACWPNCRRRPSTPCSTTAACARADVRRHGTDRHPAPRGGSERGLAAGTFEYRARTSAEPENLDHDALLSRLAS